jgi:hypothetical protein
MRGQMLERGADAYVEWKDRDDKKKEAAIAAFDATHINYDPHVLAEIDTALSEDSLRWDDFWMNIWSYVPPFMHVV